MTPPAKSVCINFFEEIISQRVFPFINFCTQIFQQHHPDILQINIASPGGNVAVGIILHNYLKSLPKRPLNFGGPNQRGLFLQTR